jgi:hypothetical protein
MIISFLSLGVNVNTGKHVHLYLPKAGSLKMNTALDYGTRVVKEGGRRCKKSTPLNDLVHLTPLRIPLMNPPQISVAKYRITLFLRTISRNVYRGDLQASAVWVLLLKSKQA